MKTTAILPESLLLILILFLAGCVPAPRKGDGRLSLRVVWKNNRTGTRGVEEIRTVTACLTRDSLRITGALNMDESGGGAAGEFGGLYPGDWDVKVDAAAADGTVIYTGRTTVTIISNEERSVAMTLLPNNGKLDFQMDIAPLLAGGLEITGGRIYIYGDPSSNSATVTEDLAREGSFLHGLVENLPTRTYDAKVAIPSISNALFSSAIFRFSILPGRTTSVFLSAEGGVDLIIGVDAEPAQVTGLVVAVEEGRAILSWQAVEGASGYRVYRTDASGRFRELALTGATTTAYVDESFAQAAHYGGLVGYAVAALAGTVEGISSDPVWVAK